MVTAPRGILLTTKRSPKKYLFPAKELIFMVYTGIGKRLDGAGTGAWAAKLRFS